MAGKLLNKCYSVTKRDYVKAICERAAPNCKAAVSGCQMLSLSPSNISLHYNGNTGPDRVLLFSVSLPSVSFLAFKPEAFIAQLKGGSRNRLLKIRGGLVQTLFFLFSSPRTDKVWFYISLLLIIANRHGRSRFIGTASFLLITTENRNATYGTSGRSDIYI